MGDKSPKSNKKQATQKQAKTDAATTKKNNEVSAKQAAGAKK